MKMQKRLQRGRNSQRKLAMLLLAAFAMLVGVASPAGAEPQGYIEAELEYGFFYGTFGESPNITVYAGGAAEEFCGGDPGVAPLRVFLRNDGTEDLKVNAKHQPIYLYETEGDAIDFLDQVCSGAIEPEPFATGVADLKVRISVLSPNLLDIFNSINGKATGIDGTEYKVRASADLMLENGIPVGNPEDFVSFSLKEIKRG